jgi:long-subunit acyl-CoA synthetase (AMP-forming)
MERAILLAVLFQKGRIGFFTGNIQKMKEDVELLKPTIILSVP